MFIRKHKCLGKELKKILSTFIMGFPEMCRLSNLTTYVHVLRCWDKTEENLRKPLVLYQCLTGVLIKLERSQNSRT